MSDVPPCPDGMSPEFYAACLAVSAKRPRTVITHILEYGFITTEELSERYGYDHPPRAVRDVRENGIPVETFKATSGKTGRQIAAYRFADTSQVVSGRVGGRKAFSKQFKEKLIAYYGARSMLTNEQLEPRYLQIDHRVPYEIAGNDAIESIENYMLLDASAQRAKSWSCEHCECFLRLKDVLICNGCFWAFPENYSHVALRQERRLYLAWSGPDVATFDAMMRVAEKREMSAQDIVKMAIEELLGRLK
ncbi:MAG: helix-turn-helix domain-containing protein [Azonexus sp.]